jgi:predicted HNH restriction endonuclease
MQLVPLVMALARLPRPVREDKGLPVAWPLEDRQFIVAEMDFDILADDGATAILEPLTARILRSNRAIDLRQRFAHIATDFAELQRVQAENPQLAEVLFDSQRLITQGANRRELRTMADEAIRRQTRVFGKTNAATLSSLIDLPPTDLENDIKGREGRWLTRSHSYRERDRRLVILAKQRFYHLHRRLLCEVCHFCYRDFYGERGRLVIEAHHRTPLEELLPDTETAISDLAMVCGNCNRIIHSRRPWISVDALRVELIAAGRIPP